MKGQVSIEYTMIAVFLMAAMVMVFGVAFGLFGEQKFAVQVADARTAANKLADTANYLCTAPANTTARVSVYIPPAVDLDSSTIGEGWLISTVDSSGDVGQWTSIDTAGSNTIYISYYDVTNGDLKFAKSVDGGYTWSTRTVASDTDQGEYSSIDAVDENTIYIGFANTTSTENSCCNQAVFVAKSTDGGDSWSNTRISSTGTVKRYVSLSAVNETTVYVSYQQQISGTLRVANTTNGGATWTDQQVHSSDSGEWSSISAIGDSTVYVSYHDGASTRQNLNVSKSTDSGQSWTRVNGSYPVDIQGDVGEHSAIYALDEDTVFGAYSDDTNDDVKFASTSDGGATWTVRVVDPSIQLNTGSYITVYATSRDEIFISYYSGFISGDFRVAKTEDGGLTWERITVDSVGDVGKYSSLHSARTSLFISYYDDTNNDLKFARTGHENTVAFVIQTEDAETTVVANAECDVTGTLPPTQGRFVFRGVSTGGEGGSVAFNYTPEVKSLRPTVG